MQERLTLLLSSISMTQAAFAEKIGVAPSTVSQWLNGKRIPSEAVIRHICQTYHVSQAWLESGEGNMYLSDHSSQISHIEKMMEDHPAAKMIVNSLTRLNDQDWNVVEKIIDSLKNEK